MRALARSSDFLCGAVLCAVAAAFFFAARGHEAGTAAEMGPAFFPLILASLLGLVGLVLCVKAVRSPGTAIATIPLRPLAIIMVSIGAFGLLLRPAGLVIALCVLLVLACLAHREATFAGTLKIVIPLVLLGVIIFRFLLSIPVGLWPA